MSLVFTTKTLITAAEKAIKNHNTGQTISASQLKMVGYDSLTELFRDALGTEGTC